MHVLEYVVWFFVVAVFMIAMEAHSGVKEAQSQQELMKPKITVKTDNDNERH